MLLLLNLILADGMCMRRTCVCECICKECTIITAPSYSFAAAVSACCWWCIRPQKKKVSEDDENNNNNTTPLYELAGWLYFFSLHIAISQHIHILELYVHICMNLSLIPLVYFIVLTHHGSKVLVLVFELWEILKNAVLHSHIYHLRLFVCIYHNTLAIISRKNCCFYRNHTLIVIKIHILVASSYSSFITSFFPLHTRSGHNGHCYDWIWLR